MTKAVLHIYEWFWDLRPDECPCDLHFVEWLDSNGIVDSVIFHFGTGGHHYVGSQNAHPARRNSVLGITASPQEYEAYVRLVIEHPELARYYLCMFGDIYLLNAKLLPEFNVVTLFHLCEFRSEQNDAYGACTDLQVAELLVQRLRPGGHLLFYTSSYAFDWDREPRAKDAATTLEQRGQIEYVGEFKTLRVYRRRML